MTCSIRCSLKVCNVLRMLSNKSARPLIVCCVLKTNDLAYRLKITGRLSRRFRPPTVLGTEVTQVCWAKTNPATHQALPWWISPVSPPQRDVYPYLSKRLSLLSERFRDLGTSE